jgi:hypothetical protein
MRIAGHDGSATKTRLLVHGPAVFGPVPCNGIFVTQLSQNRPCSVIWPDHVSVSENEAYNGKFEATEINPN